MQNQIEESINQIKTNLFPEKIIVEELFRILKLIFPKSSINIYTFSNDKKKIDITLSNKNLWAIPNNLTCWLTNPKNTIQLPFLHIKNRKKFILTDFIQYSKDQKNTTIAVMMDCYLM